MEMIQNLMIMVLQMSLTAGFTCLAVCLLRLALKRAPKIFAYALWAVVFFRFVCPVALQSPVSVIPRWEEMGRNDSAMGNGAFVLGTGNGEDADPAGYPADGPAGKYNGEPDADLTGNLPGYADGMLPENAENGSRFVPAGQNGLSAENREPQLENPTGRPEDRGAENAGFRQSLLNENAALLTAIWLGGMAVIALTQWGRSRRWKRSLGQPVMVKPGICVASGVPAPFVMGVRRPCIWLPEGISDDKIRYILLHEQIHIRRRDYLLKPLAFAIVCVHWFNPLAWLAFRLMCMDMELSCDEAVLKDMKGWQKKEYAQALLSFAERGVSGGSLAFGEPYAKKRIRNVLNYRRPAYRLTMVLTVVCLAASGCLLTNPVKTEETAETDGASRRETEEGSVPEQGRETDEASEWESMSEEEKLAFFTEYLNEPEHYVFIGNRASTWDFRKETDGRFVLDIAHEMSERIEPEALTEDERKALEDLGADLGGSLLRVNTDTLRQTWEYGTGRIFKEEWLENLSGWYHWNDSYYLEENRWEKGEETRLVCTGVYEEDGLLHVNYEAYEGAWTGEAVLGMAEEAFYFVSTDNKGEQLEEDPRKEPDDAYLEAMEMYWESYEVGNTSPVITEDSFSWPADLNHDGQQDEQVIFDWGYFETNSCGMLAVLDSEGKVLYSGDLGWAHVGWGSYYLCRRDGRDYLFKYNPWCGQGMADFTYELISFDAEGNPVTEDSGSLSAYMASGEWIREMDPDWVMDISAMAAFAETVNSYIEDSFLIASTDYDAIGEWPSGSGRDLFVAGTPEEPNRMLETYRMYNDFYSDTSIVSVEGAESMTLAEKLKTFCQLADVPYTE